MIVHILHHGLALCGEPLGPDHKWTPERVTCERCARILQEMDTPSTGDVAGRKAHEKLAEAAVLAHRAGWDEKKFQDEAFGYFDAAKEGNDGNAD